MTPHRFRLTGTLLLTLVASGCQQPAPPTHADAIARADCREQVERQYNTQNRADLTRRDERDYAFAGTYNAGIPSRGLGAEYQREQNVTNCLRAAGDRGAPVAPGVGPAFSPTETGAGASSLRP